MNCSYFAMERRRTFTVNKKMKQIKQKNKIKYKKNIQTNKKKTYKQTNQNKTEGKYTNEQTRNTLHTLNEI